MAKSNMDQDILKVLLTEEEIKAYLSGNLCRCSGYESQLRAIKNYLNRNRDKE